MNAPPHPVVLASQSPRRQELLQRLFPQFDILVPSVNEDDLVSPVPWETARLVSAKKADFVAGLRPDALVIAGDTVVAVPQRGGYRQLFKPRDTEDAISMLTELSGREHLVITGIALRWPGGGRGFEVTTGVTFRPMERAEIEAYVASGEPMDKAGSYGAQGKGASFIVGLRGSLTNVIGLPVDELKDAICSQFPSCCA